MNLLRAKTGLCSMLMLVPLALAASLTAQEADKDKTGRRSSEELAFHSRLDPPVPL
jgi:hypothetical protein